MSYISINIWILWPKDGIWDAPLVPNPDCKVGCGVWKAPMIKNPNYKGKWTAPKIPNPAYKGMIMTSRYGWSFKIIFEVVGVFLVVRPIRRQASTRHYRAIITDNDWSSRLLWMMFVIWLNRLGKWLPRQIDNPNYFVDENPISKLASLTGLAIEIWTINGGITFDNFVVARNVNAAFEYAKTSTDLKVR